jgi:hypothetical protein
MVILNMKKLLIYVIHSGYTTKSHLSIYCNFLPSNDLFNSILLCSFSWKEIMKELQIYLALVV